jgi:hypothetical protein
MIQHLRMCRPRRCHLSSIFACMFAIQYTRGFSISASFDQLPVRLAPARTHADEWSLRVRVSSDLHSYYDVKARKFLGAASYSSAPLSASWSRRFQHRSHAHLNQRSLP